MTYDLGNIFGLLVPPPPWQIDYAEQPWCNLPSGTYQRIFIFVTVWFSLYWCLLHFTQRDPEYCCRWVTLIHAVTSCCFSMTDIICGDESFDLQSALCQTEFELYYLSITLSYFIFDTIWINLWGSETYTIHMHHICSLLLLYRAISTHTGGPGVAYVVFGLECTNPYLQLRWLLRTHGYHNTPIHTIVELWFITSFLIVRIVGGTIMLYLIEFHSKVDFILKIAIIGIYIVSWLIVTQIISFLKKKYINENRLLSLSTLNIFRYRRLPSQNNPPQGEQTT